jgi:hypothetical protein
MDTSPSHVLGNRVKAIAAGIERDFTLVTFLAQNIPRLGWSSGDGIAAIAQNVMHDVRVNDWKSGTAFGMRATAKLPKHRHSLRDQRKAMPGIDGLERRHGIGPRYVHRGNAS